MRPLVPVDGNRADWARIVAKGQNATAKRVDAFTALPINLGGYKVGARTVTSTPTIADNDYLLAVNAAGGGVTVNLPALAANQGRVFKFKKLDAVNNVTIDANGAETIDGATTFVLTTQYESVELIAGASEWHVV